MEHEKIQNIKLVRKVIATFFFQKGWVQSKLNGMSIFENVDLVLNNLIDAQPGNKYRLINFWLTSPEYTALAEFMAQAMKENAEYDYHIFQNIDIYSFKNWINDPLFLRTFQQIFSEEKDDEIHKLYLKLHDSISTGSHTPIFKKIYELNEDKFPIFIMLLSLNSDGIRDWMINEDAGDCLPEFLCDTYERLCKDNDRL